MALPPRLGWEAIRRTVGPAEIEAASGTRVLLSDTPMLVPLETLDGRNHFRFPAAEQPPWQWRVGLDPHRPHPLSALAAAAGLPDGDVLFHHAGRLGQLDAGERAGEGAEAVNVVGADQAEVVVAAALGPVSKWKSSRSPPRKATLSSPRKTTGSGSTGWPSIQIARSLPVTGSLIPAVRFQATSRPSVAVPTPADQLHRVWRAW